MCTCGNHAEPQLIVSDSGFMWACPECRAPLEIPREFKNKELRLEIVEETENVNTLMQRLVAGRPSAIVREIYESAEDIYRCLVMKILEECFPGKQEFDEADRLQLALLALRAEKKVLEEEFMP